MQPLSTVAVVSTLIKRRESGMGTTQFVAPEAMANSLVETVEELIVGCLRRLKVPVEDSEAWIFI